ncbi:MAG: triose-phosphate isomerase [Betaproteobacteria bacterium]|nr:triose-phosphate isomerase [Betaproteobacteria bacterium]MDE2212190.1 triose-phosphate isomerase [Betaproteobacteria bacterium]MDE2623972.1 triose-phosphate isomerase [Betaproteobacteria bacterium]
MRNKLIAGNWKMHGSLAGNPALLQSVAAGAATQSNVSFAVLVPFPYLAQAQALLTGTSCAWGAQDVSEEAGGAFTGEVSAAMLRDFGCRYVVAGHSERRARHGESDRRVAAKALAALEAGLTPIVCVGETLDEREAGQTLAVVYRQLDAVMESLGVRRLPAIVLAYEPVWAIGTGRSATPAQAQEVHAALRQRVSNADWVVGSGLQILYGGSVKPSNALELMRLPDVDGALVGGASLAADDFLDIGRAAALA